MEIINIQISKEDAKKLDKVKIKIGAKSRPETIRFLIREWKQKNRKNRQS